MLISITSHFQAQHFTLKHFFFAFAHSLARSLDRSDTFTATIVIKIGNKTIEKWKERRKEIEGKEDL